MATLNEHEDLEQVEQLSPALESRLRAHYAQTYGHEPQAQALWARLSPHLGVQEQSAPGRRQLSDVRLLLHRLTDWTAGAFRQRRPAALAAIVMLVVLFAAAIAAWVRPAPVSAQVILERAQAASSAPPMHSYHLQATITGEKIQSAGERWTVEEWVSGTTYFRQERNSYDAQGDLVVAQWTIRNDKEMWGYQMFKGGKMLQGQVFEGKIQIDHMILSGAAKDNAAHGNAYANLAEVLAEYNRQCSTAQLQNEATLDGRDVYVVVLTPVEHCATAKGDAPTTVVRNVLWLDKQSFFPLKWENFTTDGKPLYQYEVTSLQYDIAIPESTFTYTPPAGATINEMKVTAP